MNFYILHYCNESGSKESVVLTEEIPTQEFIADHEPFEMKYVRTVKCETDDSDFGLLPLEYELTK